MTKASDILEALVAMRSEPHWPSFASCAYN
jgi:hypothetical protein